jgi:NAD+-dependent protein deacetylase sirtuin 1
LFPKANGFTFVPSRSHYFLKLLEEKGKLLRVYSQNIDMLEHAAGLSHERSILCHGSFATATCLACKRMFPGDAIRDDVMRQQVPMCKSCGAENGIVKPDIVFFGESLPRRFHDLIKADENEADLVLVMGSSLKVNPVRSLVGRIHNKAPMILINRYVVRRSFMFTHSYGLYLIVISTCFLGSPSVDHTSLMSNCWAIRTRLLKSCVGI